MDLKSKEFADTLTLLNGIPLVISFLIWGNAIYIGIPFAIFSSIFLFKKKKYIGFLWCILMGLLQFGIIFLQ